jgi:hypothetical protein
MENTNDMDEGIIQFTKHVMFATTELVLYVYKSVMITTTTWDRSDMQNGFMLSSQSILTEGIHF